MRVNCEGVEEKTSSQPPHTISTTESRERRRRTSPGTLVHGRSAYKPKRIDDPDKALGEWSDWGCGGRKTPGGVYRGRKKKKKGGDQDGLAKPSCCTYFIVPSVEVTHLSFPIFFLAFMACNSRETVERAWGQGSTRFGSEGYRNNQRDHRGKANRCAYAEKGGTYGVGGAWLAEKPVYEVMTIFRRQHPHRPPRPPSHCRHTRPRCRSRKFARRR